MNVIPIPEEEYLAKAFVLAEETLKLDNVSLRKAMYTAKRGARWSTHHAYLQRAWNRNNLHILMNTFVAKVRSFYSVKVYIALVPFVFLGVHRREGDG